MVLIGDDFGFANAEVFYKVDALMRHLVTEGYLRGFSTIVQYSSMMDYFHNLKELNLTFGNFKGDFLPYQKPFNGWDDFWSGYYSSRLYLKRVIRNVFNQIQSVKTLLVIRAIQSNNNSINFRNDTASAIDSINSAIRKAEEKWSLLMNYNGITGTHAYSTETSYYYILNEASRFIDQAYDMINKNLSVKFESENLKPYAELISKLHIDKIIYLTVVNPSGYDREEILNITLPYDPYYPDINYVFFVQNDKGDKINTSVESYYADLQEINPNDYKLVTIRKGFLKLKIPALSDAQIYVSYLLTYHD